MIEAAMGQEKNFFVTNSFIDFSHFILGKKIKKVRKIENSEDESEVLYTFNEYELSRLIAVASNKDKELFNCQPIQQIIDHEYTRGHTKKILIIHLLFYFFFYYFMLLIKISNSQTCKKGTEHSGLILSSLMMVWELYNVIQKIRVLGRYFFVSKMNLIQVIEILLFVCFFASNF